MPTHFRTLLLTVCLIFAFSAQAQTPPTQAQIMEWGAFENPNEYSPEAIFQVSEDHPLIEIRLRNKEIAYIGKNAHRSIGSFSPNNILIRPALKEAREIRHYPFDEIDGVYDLNQDSISEIVTNYSSPGCSGSSGVKQIIQFDGWEPVVLYQKGYGFTFVEWESDRYHNKTINWQFVDLNGDGIIDLDETVMHEVARVTLDWQFIDLYNDGVTHKVGIMNIHDSIFTSHHYKWVFNNNRFILMHVSDNLLENSYKATTKTQ